jgi:hypothetical protein
MEPLTAISLTKSLIEIASDLGKLNKQAQSAPDVACSVLLYLRSAQVSVSALGLERQRVLSEVGRCDVGDPQQLKSLWTRLDCYLYEDNIRPHLNSAVKGLNACRESIEKEAKTAWWRRRDKESAVADFSQTLGELEKELRELSSCFEPGAPTGRGVDTLMPIYVLISGTHRRVRVFKDSEIEPANEELGERALWALRAPAHDDWFRLIGRIEALIVELQLAFSVQVTASVSKAEVV